MRRKIEDLVNESVRNLSAKGAGLPKGKNAIRLDKGELPYPPSPHVIKAIADAAAEVNRYPELLGGVLRNALAEYTGARQEQIVIGNGSDDLIELIVKVFVQPTEEVLMPVPTFFVYWQTTQALGGNPVFVNRTDDFGLDIEALLQKVTPRTKVLFIANPNNPTGNLISRETIQKVLNSVDCIVVIDECYYEICQQTVADLVDEYPNLIILRSFSKSFGLAGLRIGYGIANETVIDYLYRAALPFPVNKLAIVGAIAALTDVEYIRSNIQQICQERTSLAQGIAQLGLFVYPSATNFLFVKTQSLAISSSDLVQALQVRNIFVQDFGLKPGLDAYHFRTSVGTPPENQILLASLEDVIKNC